MRRVVSAVAAVAAALVLLTSCSAVTGGSQSNLEACASLGQTLQAAAGAAQVTASEAQKDPKKATESVQKVISELNTARTKITNSAIGTQVDKTLAALQKTVTVLSADSIDKKKFLAATAEVATQVKDLSTVCLT